MTRLSLAFLSWLGVFFRSRHDLGLELVALRQQVGVLKRKNPRPRFSLWDRLFRLGLYRWWSKWASVLMVVKPETVAGWASRQVPRVLALPFAPPSRPTENHPRASPSDSVYG